MKRFALLVSIQLACQAESFADRWQAIHAHLARQSPRSQEARQSETLALRLEQTRTTVRKLRGERIGAALATELENLNLVSGHFSRLAAPERVRLAKIAGAMKQAIADPSPAQLEAVLALLPRDSPEQDVRRGTANLSALARGGEIDSRSILNQAGASPRQADEPTAADLAENPLVQLTPEIRAKAAELGNSPVRIYQFVRNHYLFEPYQLANLTSAVTHHGGRGNDTDLASYLIALLRAARIPARYGAGIVTANFAGLNAWLGTTSNDASLGLIQYLAPPTRTATGASFLHFYVEAYVNNAWVALDPSFKPARRQPGIRFPRPLFDRAAYLSSGDTRAAIDVYLDQVRTAISGAQAGASLEDAALTPVDEPIAADVSATLPTALPYTVASPRSISDLSVGNSFLTRMTVQVFDSGPGRPLLLRATIPCYDVISKTLSLSFDGQGQARLTLGGTVVASASRAITGRPLDVFLDNFTSDLPQSRAQYVHRVSAGQTAVFVLNMGQSSDRLLGTRTDSLLTRVASGGADPAAATTELLALAGLRYFNRLERLSNRLSAPLNVKFIRGVPEETMVLSYGPAKSLASRPFALAPDRMLIDAPGLNSLFASLESGTTAGADWNSVRQAFGLTTSTLEHEVIEELLLVPAASTTKLLQLAKSTGAQVFTITRANVASVLPLLEVPQRLLDTIRADTSLGFTVVTSDRPVPLGVFSGVGWISEAPDASQAAFQIAEGINGGDSGGNLPANHPPIPRPSTGGSVSGAHGTAVSDPVNVANGNLLLTARDLAISSRGPRIVLERTYNSLQASSNGPFGFGWTHNYLMSIRPSGATLLYTNSTGGVYTFAATADGGFACTVLPGLRLVKDDEGYLLRLPNGVSLRFDPGGRLTQISDRVSNTLRLFHDESGRLNRITDALGRDLTFSYDGQNRITEVTDSGGRVTRYGYDGVGHLTLAINAAGGRTAYTYYTDAVFARLLRSSTTPEGRVTTYAYYADRTAARVTEPGGRTARMLYLPFQSRTDVLDGRGFLSSYFYNDAGNVTRRIDADGNIWDWRFNANALPIVKTDPTGRVTRLEYDSTGNVTAVTDSLGNVSRFAYEPNSSRLTSFTDPTGAVFENVHDSQGNLIRMTGPGGMENTFTYNEAGQLLTATDAEGATRTLSYDDAGNVVSVEDGTGAKAEFAYDGLRRLVRSTDGAGNQWTGAYDALNRLISHTTPDGRTAALTLTADGQIARAQSPDGISMSFTHDELGSPTGVIAPGNSASRFDLSDPGCRCTASELIASYRDPSGRGGSFEYDSHGRLVSARDALGNERRYAYSARGELTSLTRPSGGAIRFEYDSLGRLTRKLFPDGTSASYSWNSAGNLISATNVNVSLRFEYDEAGRVARVIDSRYAEPITYSYDRGGRVTSVIDPLGGVQAFTWNSGGQLKSVQNARGATASYDYDGAGRRSGLTFSNGLVTSYRYESSGRVAAIESSAARLAYEYDSAGRRTGITDESGAHAFRYDDLDRLIEVRGPQPERFQYDSAGNRTGAGTDSYSFDAAGRLISGRGTNWTHDANGAVIRKVNAQGTTEYAYDFEGNLIQARLPQGLTVSYKYDALGRRIERSAGGAVTRYLHDGESVLLETGGSGALANRYTNGVGLDDPLMVETGGATYFHHTDAMGSVRAITNEAGERICALSYSAFGRAAATACPGIAAGPSYTGREWDADAGLYYLRNRYLDPDTGRFLTGDPAGVAGSILSGANPASVLPETLNPYAYALNNPVSWRDPLGLSAKQPGPDVPFEIAYAMYQEALRERQQSKVFVVGDGLQVKMFLRDGRLNPSLKFEDATWRTGDSGTIHHDVRVTYSGTNWTTNIPRGDYEAVLGIPSGLPDSEQGPTDLQLGYRYFIEFPLSVAAESVYQFLDLEYWNPNVAAARSSETLYGERLRAAAERATGGSMSGLSGMFIAHPKEPRYNPLGRQ